MQLRGIGPTTASALLASLGAGHDFRNGRQVAAWLGLTPGHHSSGGNKVDPSVKTEMIAI